MSLTLKTREDRNNKSNEENRRGLPKARSTRRRARSSSALGL